MSLVERIAEEMCTMPIQARQQMLDFALFLKQREQKALAADMDAVFADNLPAFKELAK